MHQETLRSLSFKIDRHESGARSVMPCIDGVSLSALVTDFETAAGYNPTGGYGPLIPEFFRFGPIDQYFLGQVPEYWAEIGGIYVLGCECGEVGCWPLQCRVEIVVEDVIWKDFNQPHRPARDYSRFGPFTFARLSYEGAVLQLLRDLS